MPCGPSSLRGVGRGHVAVGFVAARRVRGSCCALFRATAQLKHKNKQNIIANVSEKTQRLERIIGFLLPHSLTTARLDHPAGTGTHTVRDYQGREQLVTGGTSVCGCFLCRACFCGFPRTLCAQAPASHPQLPGLPPVTGLCPLGFWIGWLWQSVFVVHTTSVISLLYCFRHWRRAQKACPHSRLYE